MRYLLFFFASIALNTQAATLQGLDNPDIIPGQYVVVLKPPAILAARSAQEKISAISAEAMAKKKGFQIKHRFHSSLNGFTLKLSGVATQAQHTQQLQTLLDNPEVAFIEADRRIYLEPRSEADISLNSIQTLLPTLWGLDRINQQHLPLDYTYSFNATGKNVHAYLIASGINTEHKEFAGRIAAGMNFVKDDRGENDCDGHGTHVAAILGGTTFGAAKNVSLHPVRVFGCDESAEYSAIIAAIEWVIDHYQAPALINMSLGGPRFEALNRAVENAIAAGIVVVSAAGNLATDACNTSPSGSANVIAVGSSTILDTRSSFSNIGKCVTIFAPGSNILSAWISGSQAEMLLSGTSMAAPYVAGVVARYLEKNPAASPAAIKTALQNGGTRNVLSDLGNDSPNLLLNSEIDLDTAVETEWQRTLVFIYGETQPGQDMFIRGGIDHNFALNNLQRNCNKDNMLCAIPIRHLNLRNATTEPWKRNDLHLDWYGTELNQDAKSQGSALDWTTNAWSAQWGPAHRVAEDGYGETPFNQWGNHYWMLDITMDCSKTVNGWFELKSFISNGPGWESDINQASTPYVSKNHFAQCGKLNVFMRGQNNPIAIKNI